MWYNWVGQNSCCFNISQRNNVCETLVKLISEKHSCVLILARILLSFTQRITKWKFEAIVLADTQSAYEVMQTFQINQIECSSLWHEQWKTCNKLLDSFLQQFLCIFREIENLSILLFLSHLWPIWNSIQFLFIVVHIFLSSEWIHSVPMMGYDFKQCKYHQLQLHIMFCVQLLSQWVSSTPCNGSVDDRLHTFYVHTHILF